MTETVKIHGVPDTVRKLKTWKTVKIAGLGTYIDKTVAPMLENYAKTNRPWTDRTGRARGGLKAHTVMSTNEISLQLWHSVYYGIFLEVCQAGKYSILRPTIDRNKSTVYAMIKKYWSSK